MVGGKGSSRNAVTDIFLDLFTKYGVVTEELYPDDVNMECMTRSRIACLSAVKAKFINVTRTSGIKSRP